MESDYNIQKNTKERNKKAAELIYERRRKQQSGGGKAKARVKEWQTSIIVDYDYSAARKGLILLCIVPIFYLLHPLFGWSLWICSILALLATLIIALTYETNDALSVGRVDITKEDFENTIEDLYKKQRNIAWLSKVLIPIAIILTTIPFVMAIFGSPSFNGSMIYYFLYIVEIILLLVIWYNLPYDEKIIEIHNDLSTRHNNEDAVSKTANKGSVTINATSTFSVDIPNSDPTYGILSLIYDESEDTLKNVASWIKEIFRVIQIYENPSSEDIIGSTDVALCLMGVKSESIQVIDTLTLFYNMNKRIVPIAIDEHSSSYGFKFRIEKFIWGNEDSREELCSQIASWQGYSNDTNCISGALVNVTEIGNREVEVFVSNKKIGMTNQDFRLGTGEYDISCILTSNKFCIINFKLDVDASKRTKYFVTIDVGKYLDSLLQVKKSKLEWKGGHYFGQTYSGMPHGSGEYSQDNSTYQGEWEFGSKSGQGKITDMLGVYEGEWKDDKRNGIGTQIYTISHEKYVGSWKDGKRDGEGTYYGKDTEVKCIWKNDMPYEADAIKIPFAHGHYSGKIIRGKRQGMGTFTINGKNISGMWIDDMPSGEMTINYSNGLRYIGELGSDLLRNGYGKMYYNDGSEYEGYWRYDKRDGYGTLTTCQSKVSGAFRNGKFIG